MDLIVYKLKWTKKSGLWDNGGRISIHWPFFTSFHMKKDICPIRNSNSFYIEDSDGDIEPLEMDYFGIEDIVFKKKVYSWSNKTVVYTTLEPYN